MQILIVCTSRKTSYNVLSHSMTVIIWGLGRFVGKAVVSFVEIRGGGWGEVAVQEIETVSSFRGAGVVQEIESLDLRSPEILTVLNILADSHTIEEFLTPHVFHRFMLGVTTTVDKLVLELQTIRLYPEESTQQ